MRKPKGQGGKATKENIQEKVEQLGVKNGGYEEGEEENKGEKGRRGGDERRGEEEEAYNGIMDGMGWDGWDVWIGWDGIQKQRNKEGGGRDMVEQMGSWACPPNSSTNGTNQPKHPFPDWRSTHLPDGTRWYQMGVHSKTIDIKLCSAFRNIAHR